jgi:hypothetical protein
MRRFDETFDVGADTGTPVSLDYDVPFAFTGRLEKVTVSLGEPGRAAGEPRMPGQAGARLRAGE